MIYKQPNTLVVLLEAHLKYIKDICDGKVIRWLEDFELLNVITDEVVIMLTLITEAKEK